MADQELEVDGQLFAIRCIDPDRQYNYTWLNGPVAGYGFSSRSSEPVVYTEADHLAAITDFLAQVDPGTGLIPDD